ncbi:MAG: cupin domain-containing protein [Rhodospirillales bacterium]
MAEFMRKGRFPAPVDRSAVAADWAGRGFSCDLFVDPPGRAWVDFVHDSNELVTVTEGRLEITVNGTRALADPGDEVFIARGHRHSVRNVAPVPTRWLYGYDD